MIVQFTLHPTAFFLNGQDHAQRVSIVKTVEKYWLHSGLFVHLSECPDGQLLSEMLASLDPEIRKLWKELLMQANRRSRIRACSKETIGAFKNEPAACLRQLARTVELVCLDSKDGPAFSIPADQPCFLDAATGIEVCRIDCVESSKAFSAAYDKLKGAFRKGETRERILNDFIEPHAKLHSKIVVVDRYAIERHIEGNGSPTGFVSILRSLNSMPNSIYLTIYSAICTIDTKAWTDNIRTTLKKLGPGSLAEVVVYLCPPKLFSKNVHHRYIQFGPDAALFLDFGLELLESAVVQKNCKYHYDWSRLIIEESESALRQGVRPIRFEQGDGLAKAPQSITSGK